MKTRFVLASMLILSINSALAEAGPSFGFNAGPQPGSSAGFGNASYSGPNLYSGQINAVFPFGIVGSNTPLDSGKVLSEAGTFFGFSGMTGAFDIVGGLGGADFTGRITSSNVGATGGTFNVVGFFSATAAAFFGLSPSAELAGSVSLQLSPAQTQGTGGSVVGAVQFTFSPDGNTAVPEPSSLALCGIAGVVGAGMVWKRRARVG